MANSKGNTPLIRAVLDKDLGAAPLLVGCKADVDWVDAADRTALCLFFPMHTPVA